MSARYRRVMKPTGRCGNGSPGS